jgi:DNA-binding response OmpR family regulator
MSVSESVLIVDDDDLLAQIAALHLTQAGYETRVVAGGQAALLARAERPSDLVLMDIQMPGIDGVEALRRLRKAGHAMPVVMMTHDNRADVIRDVLALGGNGYLLKPFEGPDLVARVRKALDAAKVARR